MAEWSMWLEETVLVRRLRSAFPSCRQISVTIDPLSRDTIAALTFPPCYDKPALTHFEEPEAPRAPAETFEGYLSEAKRLSWTTVPDILPRAAYLALGLTGESGEVADALKKFYRARTEELYPSRGTIDHAILVEELGDVLWYWVHLCDALEVSPSEVAENNLAKIEARKSEGKK